MFRRFTQNKILSQKRYYCDDGPRSEFWWLLKVYKINKNNEEVKIYTLPFTGYIFTVIVCYILSKK